MGDFSFLVISGGGVNLSMAYISGDIINGYKKPRRTYTGSSGAGLCVTFSFRRNLDGKIVDMESSKYIGKSSSFLLGLSMTMNLCVSKLGLSIEKEPV